MDQAKVDGMDIFCIRGQAHLTAWAGVDANHNQ
jgi:hypothetical protein